MHLFYALCANNTQYQACLFTFFVMITFFTFSKVVQESPHALLFVLKPTNTLHIYKNKHFFNNMLFCSNLKSSHSFVQNETTTWEERNQNREYYAQ
jgi:hypothetical protein